MISANTIDSKTFEVIVHGNSTTTHRLTVAPDYYQQLTKNRITPEVLVEKSVQFLLDRESNTSILRSFDLSVIGRYFPQYESVIKEMLE
jgi:hypothetical protein